MARSKALCVLLALTMALAIAPLTSAQPYPVAHPLPRRGAFLLGTAHVDGPTDHDNIKVGRYAGRYHFVMLTVRFAPIQFDHVVVHYGNGTAETLPVNTFIGPGRSSQWIRLPGRRRVVRSLELWYARAQPSNPTKPEVELFGAP